MTSDHHAPPAHLTITRRRALRTLGLTLAAAPFVDLVACSSAKDTASAAGGDGGTRGTGGTKGTGGTGGATADAGGWATGGTAAMTAKATYPNPFTSSTSTTCAMTCQATQGPCYSSQSVQIQDISYGYDGLPMRMYLQVLDDTCKAVSGAIVDTWHVAPVGKYSGDDSAHEDIAFCTDNDTQFTSHLYFRGKQTTDAMGVVFFDTCFPGWYSGRTIHVHLTITLPGGDSLTTQLVFEDALDDSIVATQPLYDTRGPRDTTNETDNVVGGESDLTPYLFQTERMSDGAMLAWKKIIVRSSTAESLCTAVGAASDGGMGMGGPPPDGGMGGGPPDGG